MSKCLTLFAFFLTSFAPVFANNLVPLASFGELADAYEKGDHAGAFARAVPVLRETGDVKTRTLIARMYLLGNGTIRHIPTAFSHYEKASNAGYAPAQVVYAQMLERGLVTAANPERAATVLEAAANQGLPVAMIVLAERIQSADGPQRNLQESEKWLLVATKLASGFPDLVARAEVLRKKNQGALTSEQSKAAEKAALEWLRKTPTANPEWSRKANALPDMDEVARYFQASIKTIEDDKRKSSPFTKDFFPKQQ